MKKTKHRVDLVIAIAFVEDFVSPFQSILVFFFFSSSCFGLIPQAFSDSSLCPPGGGTYILSFHLLFGSNPSFASSIHRACLSVISFL